MSPRVKTTKAATKATKATSIPTDSDGYLIMPKALLMEFRALDAECRHALLSLHVASQDLNALLAKHPEIQHAMSHKAAMISESANKKDALDVVHRTIEKTYSVKINEISIDDVTGRIHQLVDGRTAADALQPVPPVPKKRARRAAKAT